MTEGMAVTEGMAAVQARLAQLQALMGLPAGGVMGRSGPASATGGTSPSGTDFAGILAGALTGTDPATGDPAGTGSLGERAVALARGYQGVPYLWGGTDPSKGLDCSGLTQLVYQRLGVQLPRVAADQAQAGTEVGSLAAAQPGDLLCFGSPVHHVGIYVGDGKMIDAPHRGATVGVHAVAGYGPVSHVRRLQAPQLPRAGIGATPGTAAGAGAVRQYGGVPPYQETRDYVQRVTSAWEARR